MALQQTFASKCFNGQQKVFQHESSLLGCDMNFGIYLPPQAVIGASQRIPVLYFLSGLTDTHELFIHRSGCQRYAAELNMIIVNPDTSPRGPNVPDLKDSIDVGFGAGWYVDATAEPWSRNYKMYSYITKELPQLIESNFPASTTSRGITGHSMGGHGSMICALKTPDFYQSISAFCPIANASACEWGQNAFSHYFGKDEQEKWRLNDPSCLAETYSGPHLEILVDQGDKDPWMHQLLPDNLLKFANRNSHLTLNWRTQKDYDHSYYFVSTFIGDHLKYHSTILQSHQ